MDDLPLPPSVPHATPHHPHLHLPQQSNRNDLLGSPRTPNGLNATYVQVAPFHLQRYLDEQAFRYNVRKTDDAHRFANVMATTIGRRVAWRQLCQVDGCGFMGLQ